MGELKEKEKGERMATILVVEDESIVATDIKRCLQNLGYHVTALVSSGAEALKIAQKTPPDLVLMDIVLKGDMDGIEAAETIRSQFNIPVIYLTAYADEKTLQRAKMTEPYGYILKPIEDKELHSTIEMALYKHRMEKKVRESKQWLATTLKSIGDGIIATDTQGQITFMNPVAEALTGWTQKVAVRKLLDTVFTITTEEPGAEIENPVTRVLQEESVCNLGDHKILVARDGREIDIADSAAPIRDEYGGILGVVLVFRDITEQKHAERAVKGAEKKFRDIFNYASDAMLIHDVEGHFLEVNRTACEQLGYTKEELLHLTPMDINPSDYTLLAPERIEELKRKGHVFFETSHITKEDTIIPIELSSRMIEFEGTPSILSIARDITDRKRTEMQLKTLFEASKSVNSTVDMTEIYRIISDAVQQLVGFDNFAIFRVSEDTESVYCAYTSEGMGQICDEVFQYGEELVSNCIATGEQPLLVRNGYTDARTKIPEAEASFTSQIVLPIIIENTCAGALHISKAAPNAYDHHDLAVLQPVSEVISSAIKNVTLYNEVKEFGEELEQRIKERSQRIEILLNTRMRLQEEGSWEKGLQIIAESMGKLGFDRCGVFLVNSMKKTLEFHFGEGVELPNGNTHIPLRNTEYFGVKCVLEKRTIRIEDYNPEKGKQITSESESFVWVPIVVQNEAFAALGADNVRSKRRITDEDVEDLEILAGMCAAFIDRTRMLLQPVAEERLKTKFDHWLDPAECYIVGEKRPEKAVEMFCDLTTHGIPGFIISRAYPEKLRRKYKLTKTPMLWLSRSEVGHTISPEDLPKLIYIINDFTRKSEESVILLDGIEYLMSQTSFNTVLKFLQELKDIITMNNSRLIVPVYKDTLPVKVYSMLEREFFVL